MSAVSERRQRPAMHERIRERRRAVARAALRRRRRTTLSIVVLFALAVGGFAATYTPLFAIDEVRVTGVTADRVDAVRVAAGVQEGARLFSVDLAAVARRVEALAWVAGVEAGREPPSTVVLDVAPRNPVAVVHTADAVWQVDQEGVVVAGGSADRLVRIDATNSVLPGVGTAVTDAAVRNALQVHAGLPGPLRAAVVRYEAPSERGLRLLLATGAAHAEQVWVRFGAAERVAAKARAVGLLLDHVREAPQATAIAEIDVRAPEHPVLVPHTGG